ncbi:MAG: hypothetical protein ABFD07_12635 [Methanobacterium sp.]
MNHTWCGGDQIEFKKLFLIIIIITGGLNVIYADSGPNIGANQAQITANDYLSSHNLHYTAATPSDNDWQIKVKDTKTGEVKWISFMEYNSDMYEHESENRYTSIQDVPTIWIVNVNDYWKNVGQIYINSETGEILKVIINGNTMENMMKEGHQTNDSFASNTTNVTDPLPQDTSDNTTIIVLAVVSILIIAGTVGYWFKIRK